MQSMRLLKLILRVEAAFPKTARVQIMYENRSADIAILSLLLATFAAKDHRLLRVYRILMVLWSIDDDPAQLAVVAAGSSRWQHVQHWSTVPTHEYVQCDHFFQKVATSCNLLPTIGPLNRLHRYVPRRYATLEIIGVPTDVEKKFLSMRLLSNRMLSYKCYPVQWGLDSTHNSESL